MAGSSPGAGRGRRVRGQPCLQVPEKLQRALGPVMGTTPQDHHHVRFHRATVYTQEFLRKDNGGGDQQEEKGEQNEYRPPKPFSRSSHGDRALHIRGRIAMPRMENPVTDGKSRTGQTLRQFAILGCVTIFSAKQRVIESLAGLGRFTLLAKEALVSLITFKVASRDLLYQVFFIGVKSQAVVLITGAFTGMVMGWETYVQFHKVKMDTATLAVVGVSMCDELGPVLTALMVAGRVGAAIAAELGTMRVTEQIDALRTLATHPVDYLVVPRVAAGHIALPLLTAESICLGISASFIVCVELLGIDPAFLWHNMLHFTHDVDVVIGATKAFIFGGIITLIGCYKGLTCGLGAEGVGRATTEAVVYACITILISDFFLTMMLTKLVGQL